MTDREAYRRMMEAQLDEWEAEIQKLSAKARKSQAQAEIDYDQAIRNLEDKREVVRSKLDELSRASGDAWEEMKRGLEIARADLKASVANASQKLETAIRS